MCELRMLHNFLFLQFDAQNEINMKISPTVTKRNYRN
jgi:hypothetical protein